MLALTLEEIAAIVGGTIHDAPDALVAVVAPVMHDSRQVEPGGMFVALPGARVDGHHFVNGAIEAGAVAVLAGRPVGVPAVVVSNVVEAYGRLARGVIDRLNAVVVGVTGSVGKTSTKDILGQVLGTFGDTVTNRASNNNELGLPYTVTRATAETRHLVLEMGARGIGHVRYLTEIAPPRVGVVTKIGSAHLGEFGSVDNIVTAKGELIEALPEDGLAVLNADDPRVLGMADRTKARVLTFGLDAGADVRAEDVASDEDGRPTFQLVFGGDRAEVRLRLYGAHQLANALAAATVAVGLGHRVGAVAEALSRAEALSPGRMQVTVRPDGITVINDAYNASPDAMRAALRALADMTARDGRRAVAVLGEMAELGDEAPQTHREIGERVAGIGAGWLVAIGGDGADQYAAGASTGNTVVDRVPDASAALGKLRAGLRSGDVVLVKAANAAGLQALAHQLTEPGGVPAA